MYMYVFIIYLIIECSTFVKQVINHNCDENTMQFISHQSQMAHIPFMTKWYVL